MGPGHTATLSLQQILCASNFYFYGVHLSHEICLVAFSEPRPQHVVTTFQNKWPKDCKGKWWLKRRAAPVVQLFCFSHLDWWLVGLKVSDAPILALMWQTLEDLSLPQAVLKLLQHVLQPPPISHPHFENPTIGWGTNNGSATVFEVPPKVAWQQAIAMCVQQPLQLMVALIHVFLRGLLHNYEKHAARSDISRTRACASLCHM